MRIRERADHRKEVPGLMLSKERIAIEKGSWTAPRQSSRAPLVGATYHVGRKGCRLKRRVHGGLVELQSAAPVEAWPATVKGCTMRYDWRHATHQPWESKRPCSLNTHQTQKNTVAADHRSVSPVDSTTSRMHWCADLPCHIVRPANHAVLHGMWWLYTLSVLEGELERDPHPPGELSQWVFLASSDLLDHRLVAIWPLIWGNTECRNSLLDLYLKIAIWGKKHDLSKSYEE
jgi:hypothetical protein